MRFLGCLVGLFIIGIIGGLAMVATSKPYADKQTAFSTGAKVAAVGWAVVSVLTLIIPDWLHPYVYVAAFIGPCALVGWRASVAYGKDAVICVANGVIIGSVICGLVSYLVF